MPSRRRSAGPRESATPSTPLASGPPEQVPPDAEPFWRAKTLEEMTTPEWESLCDGCGLCCLVKLEDDDTGDVHYTDVGCTLLDGQTCRCRSYPTRQTIVPDCLKLTPEAVRKTRWLPRTCAYRLVAEGRDLFAWHPLRSGDPTSVHQAGASVRDRVAGPEEEFDDEALMDRLVAWPEQLPENRPLANRMRRKAGGKTRGRNWREDPTF